MFLKYNTGLISTVRPGVVVVTTVSYMGGPSFDSQHCRLLP